MPPFTPIANGPFRPLQLCACLAGLLLTLLSTSGITLAASAKAPPVAHPIVAPHLFTKHLRCPNCGMKLNMWARTRHTFSLSSEEQEVCSLHCVAEMARQSRETPREVMVALYLEPETIIAATQAFYVVGSRAAGTMSAISKIAFAKREAALNFTADYGGQVMSFAEALTEASEEL